MMISRGTRPDEFRITPKQLFQSRDFAGDDPVDRRLELCDGRMLALKRFEVFDEFLPTIEMLIPQDNGFGVIAAVVRPKTPRSCGRTLLAEEPLVFAKQTLERWRVPSNHGRF